MQPGCHRAFKVRSCWVVPTDYSIRCRGTDAGMDRRVVEHDLRMASANMFSGDGKTPPESSGARDLGHSAESADGGM